MTDQPTLAALWASSHVVPIAYEWPELVFLIVAAVAQTRSSRWLVS